MRYRSHLLAQFLGVLSGATVGYLFDHSEVAALSFGLLGQILAGSANFRVWATYFAVCVSGCSLAFVFISYYIYLDPYDDVARVSVASVPGYCLGLSAFFTVAFISLEFYLLRKFKPDFRRIRYESEFAEDN